MPVRACEFDVDSEDDSREEFRWIRENMFNQINEFTDVNKDEKLVMQLWNHHLMSRKVKKIRITAKIWHWNFKIDIWTNNLRCYRRIIFMIVVKKFHCDTRSSFWREICAETIYCTYWILSITACSNHPSKKTSIYSRICLVQRLSNRTILPKIGLTGQFCFFFSEFL